MPKLMLYEPVFAEGSLRSYCRSLIHLSAARSRPDSNIRDPLQFEHASARHVSTHVNFSGAPPDDSDIAIPKCAVLLQWTRARPSRPLIPSRHPEGAPIAHGVLRLRQRHVNRRAWRHRGRGRHVTVRPHPTASRSRATSLGLRYEAL
jgi:hypothetical protein